MQIEELWFARLKDETNYIFAVIIINDELITFQKNLRK